MLPWIAVGTGAGLIAAGGVVGLLANGDFDEAEGIAGRSTTEDDVRLTDYEDTRGRGESKAMLANVLYGAGGLAAAAGVALLLLDGPGGASVFGVPGGAGLRVGF